ncbi:MAG TPA: DUF2203 domain-containing protein [Gemmatimonadaceae bacterium]
MKLFTVDQANATLPLVRRIVADVVRQHAVWREKILELDLVASGGAADDQKADTVRLEHEVQALAREIAGFQRELGALGIEMKDPRLGLIDFPTDMNGRRVLLCWRLNEPEVQFWHEVDAGYSGRQPLAPLLVG